MVSQKFGKGGYALGERIFEDGRGTGKSQQTGTGITMKKRSLPSKHWIDNMQSDILVDTIIMEFLIQYGHYKLQIQQDQPRVSQCLKH